LGRGPARRLTWKDVWALPWQRSICQYC